MVKLFIIIYLNISGIYFKRFSPLVNGNNVEKSALEI